MKNKELKHMDKNDIIEKVEKLMKMASENSGATQGEIENALKLSNKLMSKYQLSSDDILLGYSDVESSELFAPKKTGETGTWRWDLIDTIAKGNLCTTYSHSVFITKEPLNRWGTRKRVNTGNKITIVGSDMNRRLVIGMCNMCIERFPLLAVQRWNERVSDIRDEYISYFGDVRKISTTQLIKEGFLPPKNRYINSYYKGAIRGIYLKLQENLEELPQDEFHKWGLMVYKNDALLNDFIKEKVGNIGKSSSRAVKIDSESYKKGLEDAKHIEEKQLSQ